MQIAKLHGCRVVGIAGTDEKCAWLVDELGLDGAINHRTDDLPTRLRELCPKRVDVFFDNTGGPILDAVLGRIADRARVVLCGAISSYNDHHKPPGPPNYLNLISRRARMEGFISWDSWGRWAEITGDPRRLDRRRASSVTGPTSSRASSPAPQALNAMFTGDNTGKVVIRVDADGWRGSGRQLGLEGLERSRRGAGRRRPGRRRPGRRRGPPTAGSS